jgi:hypothetical protein
VFCLQGGASSGSWDSGYARDYDADDDDDEYGGGYYDDDEDGWDILVGAGERFKRLGCDMLFRTICMTCLSSYRCIASMLFRQQIGQFVDSSGIV